MAGAAATFLAAGNANAAMEVATLAASDSRAGLLATLAVPAVSKDCLRSAAVLVKAAMVQQNVPG